MPVLASRFTTSNALMLGVVPGLGAGPALGAAVPAVGRAVLHDPAPFAGLTSL